MRGSAPIQRQNEEPKNCLSCNQAFDSDLKIPIMLKTCNHTICKECLVKLLNKRSVACPIDG